MHSTARSSCGTRAGGSVSSARRWECRTDDRHHASPTRRPAPELIGAGFAYESQGAATLHDGLNLADLAHVLDLLDRGIIPRPAAVALLQVVLDASSIDAIGYDPQDGEPYNSRERAFASRIGPLAGWLHAGRPRREATRLAFRLHLRRRTAHVVLAAAELAQGLATRAGEHRDVLFADQTYLQQAQPSTIGHYLLSFAYPVVRDGHRLLDVIGWLNGSPAGAGCVNGTRLLGDRAAMAARLGFDTVIVNTRDAMWQVDGLVQLVSTLASLALTQASLAEDLEIWASSEFDYVDLADEYTRASVLMPQKRNPYALVDDPRHDGRPHRARRRDAGRAEEPVGTQRQLDLRLRGDPGRPRARPAHDGADRRCRRHADHQRGSPAGGARGRVQPGRPTSPSSSMSSAGIDYRTAYEVVGAAVRRLAAAGCTGRDLTAALLDDVARDQLGRTLDIDAEALAEALDPAAIVATRVAVGGAAAEPVDAMLAEVTADADGADGRGAPTPGRHRRRRAGARGGCTAADRRGRFAVVTSDGVPALPERAHVVNVGLSLFADAIARQGFDVVNVDWRIPAGGDPEVVAALCRLYGPRGAVVDAANAEVVRRLDTGAPRAVGVRPAAEVVPGFEAMTLLHCGPPIDYADTVDPLRRSMRAAVVAEGWAEDVAAADALLRALRGLGPVALHVVSIYSRVPSNEASVPHRGAVRRRDRHAGSVFHRRCRWSSRPRAGRSEGRQGTRNRRTAGEVPRRLDRRAAGRHSPGTGRREAGYGPRW